ncbi:WXG100 family type VII secretion target [Arthrobacter oryzae]|uniref:WXG100 family type VII secretion target n=1 Tax=Arthrobacter oryzae TaxID=409290 RepID=UPI00273AC5DB|nr:WXG100 family type VII secretion target [Arthrobacter oryzae]WLQ06808.1 hypothetical protein Q8Z05_01230 [Arthrobacter oryzae]
MAPGFYGADIEQLRALSKSLGQSGTRLKNVESSVNSLVQSAAWKGSDGDKFRTEWTSTLRPMLNRSSESLNSQSKVLLAHASEQERASEGGGTTSSPGPAAPAPVSPAQGAPAPASQSTPAAVRNWGDAFTDPNYEHAPSGLEWLLEKWGADDGSGASKITSALQFVADKFSWNIDLAKVEAGTSKFFDSMKVVGKGLVVLGMGLGVLDIMSGYENRDPFRVADGAVGGGLALAAGIAAATGVGLPVAAAIGGAGLLWGLASMASGDVPVTKRIWDFGSGVVGGVKDLANGAKDALGWAGGKLGFG